MTPFYCSTYPCLMKHKRGAESCRIREKGIILVGGDKEEGEEKIMS